MPVHHTWDLPPILTQSGHRNPTVAPVINIKQPSSFLVSCSQMFELHTAGVQGSCFVAAVAAICGIRSKEVAQVCQFGNGYHWLFG